MLGHGSFRTGMSRSFLDVINSSGHLHASHCQPNEGPSQDKSLEGVFRLECNSMGRQLVEIVSAAPGGPPVRSAGIQVAGNMQNLYSSLNYTLKYGG